MYTETKISRNYIIQFIFLKAREISHIIQPHLCTKSGLYSSSNKKAKYLEVSGVELE